VDDDEEERWGYSSAEEESDEPSDDMRDNASISASMAYDSEPSTPTKPTQNLPLLAMDSVLGGEARIDMDVSFTLLDPPPPGPPSRQAIHIADEDTTIRFIGYEAVRWRTWLWNLGCVLSLGILALLGHWFPRLWLRWVAREQAFIDSHNGFVVVEVCDFLSD
jgi:cation-transporting ATPase 13A3/4/5